MGLAVSLVGAHKERVWYHKCDKRAADTCHNTRLVAEGGCNIWHVRARMPRVR